MELTIDDCLAIAGREHSTEHELRAAVCVAVGQALHYRYEASGYSDAAETAKRDADRARAEARAYSEALIAKDSAPDTSDGIDYPARAEVWRLREVVEALRARAERAEAARDENRNAWAEACRERDALRDRPTYEARTVAPTPEEAAAHARGGGAWLVSWDDSSERRVSVMLTDYDRDYWTIAGRTWIALDARRLPCAWPVVP